MVVRFERERLAAGLATVAPVVPARPSFPLLSHLLLVARAGQVTLTADNSTLRVTAIVEADVEEAGQLTVPARPLADFAAALDDRTVSVVADVTAHSLGITCGGLRSNITCGDPRFFPQAPAWQARRTLSVGTADLVEALEQVRHAMGADPHRAVLNGVLVATDEPSLVITACDGYHLAERRIPATGDVVVGERAVLPAETVAAALRTLRPTRSNVTTIEFMANARAVRITAGEEIVASTLVEGTYPRYEAMIPETTSTTARIPVVQVLSKLRAVEVFARDAGHRATVRVAPGAVSVEAAAQDLGDARLDLAVSTSGPAADITVNASYLHAAIEAARDLMVDVAFSQDSPLVVRPSGGSPLLCVVMRVNPPSDGPARHDTV